MSHYNDDLQLQHREGTCHLILVMRTGPFWTGTVQYHHLFSTGPPQAPKNRYGCCWTGTGPVHWSVIEVQNVLIFLH